MEILQFHAVETFSAVKTLAKTDVFKQRRNMLIINSNFCNAGLKKENQIIKISSATASSWQVSTGDNY